ncbi:MAG: hypothetical protein LC107_00585 [Chitinophagales bacterium]|nr:hypothetical protein [Chitinophagales bacterium]
MRFYMLFVFALLLVACKNQNTKVEDPTSATEVEDSPLYQKIMAMHDAVMPELSTIHRLKKELESMDTPENTAIIGAKIKMLDEADDAMMSWMAMFKLPDDPTQNETYLREEVVKMRTVSDMMHQAIEDASATIEELKKS